jgi:O-antigen ligase/polysaccharide polymerase Wzy-like membrane protein/tetratricopeptide repeat protein
LIRVWIESRWFGLADLACASLSGALCYSQPGLGGWPLLIALIPWAVRVAVARTGRFSFRRTWFDLPLVLFLLTAAVGVWTAYDQGRAWAKFWVMVSAVAVFYALASQPRANLWLVAGLASALGVYVAGYFLMTANWETLPADIGFLNRLGLKWMSIRPELSLHPLYDNVAGGLTAMLLPFPLAIAVQAWRERRIPMGVFALATGALTGVGLLMTSSRVAWFALAAAMGMWAIWGLSGHIARRIRRPRGLIFTLVMLAVCSPVAVFIASYPGDLASLANRLPGLPNGTSRLDLAQDTLRLAQDFLYTGGGLGAFSGLYSRYVRLILVFLFGYSHNFLLDVALEQGVFGLLALLIVMLGGAAMLAGQIWREPDAASGVGLLRWAALAGLIVVGLHGLLGDALYSEGGTPLLFLFTGMAIALMPATRLAAPGPGVVRRWTTGMAAAAAGCALLLIVFYQPLLSSWYANLGAVQMARLELAGWRDDVTNDPAKPDLSAAEASFDQALKLNPRNRTAHYRLGLIAMRDGDYTSAAAHFEAVYQLDKGDRGVNKALGYTYVWMGELDRATSLLIGIPEAREEMNDYAWWWETQGRGDLAARAAQAVARLDGARASQTP